MTGGAGLRRRVVLGAALISGLAAVVLVVAVQLVLELTATSSVDTVLADRAGLVAASARSAGGDLRVPASSLEPGVAVFDAAGGLVAGQVPPALAEGFDDLSEVRRTTSRTLGDEYRLRAEPFAAGGTAGVVVVSERSEPYEGDERAALLVSLAAGVVLVALSTALASWATRRVLRPVSQMAATAEEWSERDLDRRFGLGDPTDELRALGQTLDGLLDKVSGAIRAEQRLTSELAHELRTPLTAVIATADLLAMRTDLDDELRADLHEVRGACRAMAGSVTALLELAREGGTRTDATCGAADVVRAALAAHPEGDRTVVDVPADLRVAAPADLALRALAPLLDNALRLAPHVTVHGWVLDGQVRLEVEDDGPGLPSGLHDLFEPGVSHRTGTGTGAGTGLGLPLARRVARSLGGEVEVGPRDGGGVRSVLRLPAPRRVRPE